MGVIQVQQSGFNFPMIANNVHGPLLYVNGNTLDLIKASIRQIVLTTPGERLWIPEFGCRVRQLHFETLTETIKSTSISLVLEALQRWENRIIVTANDISVMLTSDNNIEIRVRFKVKNPDFTTQQDALVILSI